MFLTARPAEAEAAESDVDRIQIADDNFHDVIEAEADDHDTSLNVTLTGDASDAIDVLSTSVAIETENEEQDPTIETTDTETIRKSPRQNKGQPPKRYGWE